MQMQETEDEWTTSHMKGLYCGDVALKCTKTVGLLICLSSSGTTLTL